VLVIYTYLWVRVWRNLDTVRVYRSIYNAATVSITCVAISGMLAITGLRGDFGSSAASSLVAAVIAIAVYSAVNTGLVGAAIFVSGGRRLTAMVGSRSDNVLEFATLGLGAVTAVLVIRVPWLALIVLPAVFLLQHQALIRQLVEAATIDAKTELLNAAAWRQIAQRELERAERQHTMTAVLVIDMDRFKQINDTYGHLAGDTALKAVGEALSDELRGYDAVGRFGGEEFVALLPGVDGPAARGVGERIRNRIESLIVKFEHRTGGSDSMKVTASIGVAAAPGAGADLDDLLRLADDALYAAKDSGRNAVRLAKVHTVAA
jgi:diguanylate cyclase (GGDEF)-like protein